MYIKKVTLENIRCFENITIDLSSENGAKKWAVIVGDNGAGKTTLLRCIAIGICDKDEATSLLQDLSTELIRRGSDKPAKISVEFWDSEEEKFSVITKIERTDYGEEFLEKEYPEGKEHLLKKLFACGYGANRGIDGKDDPADRYSVADAVYNLTYYEHPLFDAEKQMWRITEGDKELIKTMCEWLHYLLMIPDNCFITLTSLGIRLISDNGLDLPLSVCGDGYQSTTTWIVDLIGRYIQANSKKPLGQFDTKFSGIVFLDEIEQHLHPKWQKEIIYRLAKQFPNIQFIVSTHSPLCAIGTTELEDQDCCLISLLKKEDRVESLVSLPPRGQRTDQVLTSYLFGLITASDNQIKSAVRKYAELSSVKRNEQQEKDFAELKSYLNQTLGKAEDQQDQKIFESIRKTYRDNNQGTNNNDAINYEIIRQLKEITGGGE